jgi:hypothetical protein
MLVLPMFSLSFDPVLDPALRSPLSSQLPNVSPESELRLRQSDKAVKGHRQNLGAIAIFPDGSVVWDAPSESPLPMAAIAVAEPEIIQPEILALQPEFTPVFTPVFMPGFASERQTDYRITITVPCAEV